MKETWRTIIGYKGLYSISDKGRVWSLPRTVEVQNGRIKRRRVKGKFLSFAIVDGYNRVNLYREGKSLQYSVHRLVIEAFVGPCPNGMEVNHKNGIRTDNRMENLEYVTRSGNANHAFHTLESRSKMSKEKVLKTRKLLKNGMSLRKTAKRVGIGHKTVHDIKHGRHWSSKENKHGISD